MFIWDSQDGSKPLLIDVHGLNEWLANGEGAAWEAPRTYGALNDSILDLAHRSGVTEDGVQRALAKSGWMPVVMGKTERGSIIIDGSHRIVAAHRVGMKVFAARDVKEKTWRRFVLPVNLSKADAERNFKSPSRRLIIGSADAPP